MYIYFKLSYPAEQRSSFFIQNTCDIWSGGRVEKTFFRQKFHSRHIVSLKTNALSLSFSLLPPLLHSLILSFTYQPKSCLLEF